LLIGREFIWIPDWVSTPGLGHVMVIFMGILPLIGIFDFYLRGNMLERRRPTLAHIVFSILIVFGAVFAVCERIFIRGDSVFNEFWKLSDTLSSGIAFGLLVPFYKIEKEKRLLLFLLPFALIYLGVPFAAAVKILNPSLSGFPTYEQRFWLDAWFWSDMTVNVGIGAFILWSLLRKQKILSSKKHTFKY